VNAETRRGVRRLSEKTRGEAGVERAEALVLDDVRRDRDRAAGGAELKADLWFVRTSTCLGSTERTYNGKIGKPIGAKKVSGAIGRGLRARSEL
jgi:hypothetical protein